MTQDSEPTISIGHTADGRESLDRAPLKAYLTWHQDDGKVARQERYTRSELEAEIERRNENGESSQVFEEALNKLAAFSGKRT
ncbi:MAG TPA: hypothetical protein VM616_03870 [Gammaproteobacteria bacterium]|nr:hypothetical protein [Gammaproteobacteria bacterium]